jgi:hypothetical protein
MKEEGGGKNEKVDLRRRMKDFALRVIRMCQRIGRDALCRVLNSTSVSRPRRSSALPLQRIDRNICSDYETCQTEVSSDFVHS